MTRVLRDARLASGLVTRSGRLLQGELVPPSARCAIASSASPPPTSLYSLKEHQVHSRTSFLFRFRVVLPSVEATGRWREREPSKKPKQIGAP